MKTDIAGVLCVCSHRKN